jgi:hypothetical protein
VAVLFRVARAAARARALPARVLPARVLPARALRAPWRIRVPGRPVQASMSAPVLR